MRNAAKKIKGKHDFSNIVLSGKKDSVREIHKLEIRKSKNDIHIDVVGNGFLYKMVRRLVGLLIDASRNKISLKDVENILSGKVKNYSIKTVPACGLMLMKVGY